MSSHFVVLFLLKIYSRRRRRRRRRRIYKTKI